MTDLDKITAAQWRIEAKAHRDLAASYTSDTPSDVAGRWSSEQAAQACDVKAREAATREALNPDEMLGMLKEIGLHDACFTDFPAKNCDVIKTIRRWLREHGYTVRGEA